MIKIKINEARYVSALTQQAQKIPLGSKQTRKIETKPTSSITPTEPAASTEPVSEDSIPSDWSATPGTQIELDGKKYKVGKNGAWYLGNRIISRKTQNDLISALNLEAYKQEKVKPTSTEPSTTPTSTTATTVPLEAEEAPTEEAASPLTVEEETINYIELYEEIFSFDVSDLNDISPFVIKTINYLRTNNESFKQAHERMKTSIANETTEIFNEFKFIKDVEDTSKAVADFFMENRKKQQLLEAIDPNVGLTILAGVFAFGGGLTLNKYFKNKLLLQDFENTPEARYLKKLGLLLLIKFISSFIYDSQIIDNYINSASSDIKEYMKQFKKSKWIPFRERKLFKQIDEDLKYYAKQLYDEIEYRSSNSTTISESIINRWKVLANIK